MAQGNYESGFNIGAKSSTINLDPFQKGLTGISDELKKQQEIGRARQEKFDKARSEFKRQQQEAMGSLVYEDQFIDTGLKDFDAAGEALRKSVKNTFETNMFAYNSGAIDENELRRRNAITKGHIKEMSGVYDKAKAALDLYNKLESEGKGSAANDIKVQALKDFFEKFRVQEGSIGLEMSTVSEVDGQKKITTVTPDQFNNLFNFGQGVDLSSDLKSIIDEVGSDTYIQGNTKFQDWLKGEGKLDDDSILRFNAIVEGYSDDQIIDAAKRLKTASSKKITVNNLDDETLLADLKKEVSDGMADYVKEELRLKKSSVPVIQKTDGPNTTVEERRAASQSYEVYSNVRSLFSEDPEIANSALQNLQNSSDKIKQIFRSGKDKITVQYVEDKRPDTVISLPYTQEKGFNVEDAALATTAEILSNSSKNSLDISKKAQQRYNKQNGISGKTYVPEFNDFGSASLRKGINDVKPKKFTGFTLTELLDSNNPNKYEDAVLTLMSENGINTSDLLIRKESPYFGDNYIEIDVISNGKVLDTIVISENQELTKKIKTIQDLALSMMKGGFSETENKKVGVLDN